MIEFELIDDSQTIDANLIDDTETIEVGLIKEIDKYSDLKELPSINDVTLIGNKTLHDLGIQPEGDYATSTELQEGLATKVDKVAGKGLSTNDYTTLEKEKLASLENYDDTEVRELIDTKQPRGNYLTEETDPTVPNHVKTITQNDITNWNNKADESDIPDVSDFITKDVNNLTYYELKTNTGSLIDLEINDSTYVVTLKLKNSNGTTISTDTIDLPLESVVVGGSYDSETKEVVLSLEGGSEVRFSVADLVSGLQSEITSSNKLASDLVDDSNSGNKFVTSSQKTSWNAKYDKPNGGIPKTDLASDVQTSLGKADTAIQSLSPAVLKDGGSATQTISLSSGTGTTALGIKSRSTSSYISFSNSSAWLGSIGVTADKKPTFYNGTSYMLAYTSDIPKIFYGTSATGASTSAKVIVCEDFTESDLVAGTRLVVHFTNGNSYNGQATLNVNSTGAKNIYYNGTTTNARYMWVAGESVEFIYNGTQWATINGGLATTSYYGVTKLATGANSDSQAYALTPRSLYYFANYSICPYYSASKTYAVGDKVRYTYYIYECTTAIDTPESWNAEHWQQIDPLQVQINALEARIKALENS